MGFRMKLLKSVSLIEEISKILTNIVEFEVFITNNEDSFDIFG